MGLVRTTAAVAYQTGAGGAGGAGGQDVRAVDTAEAEAGVVAGLAGRADYCDNCVEGYAFNNTVQCEPCSTVYPNCQSCDNSQCLGCLEEMQL